VTTNAADFAPLSPSAIVMGAIAIAGSVAGTSSLTITPVADASSIVAPVALDSRTRNVSSGSTNVSPRMATGMLRVVVPGVKTSEPFARM
jgi:hypothetical protein